MRNALLAGDPDFTARYLEQIARVTPADVQRVAAAEDAEGIAVTEGGGGDAPSSPAASP